MVTSANRPELWSFPGSDTARSTGLTPPGPTGHRHLRRRRHRIWLARDTGAANRAAQPDSPTYAGNWTVPLRPRANHQPVEHADSPAGRISALPFRIVQCIVQDMQKSAPPPLLPLLRSRLQAEVLTLVLLNPDKEWTLTELASRVGSSVSSVQREIVRAERAGVMASRRVGRSRLVTAARSPLTAPLTELLLRSFGPRQILADELADVPGIEDAYLFGSWAARYSGQEGRPPADLDVLVIGAPDRDALDDAAQRAGARLAREVNVTIRSAEWWRCGDDGFHAEVTRRPLVPVVVQETGS
jgi:predicted nucleotidyltransferase